MPAQQDDTSKSIRATAAGIFIDSSTGYEALR